MCLRSWITEPSSTTNDNRQSAAQRPGSIQFRQSRPSVCEGRRDSKPHVRKVGDSVELFVRAGNRTTTQGWLAEESGCIVFGSGNRLVKESVHANVLAQRPGSVASDSCSGNSFSAEQHTG